MNFSLGVMYVEDEEHLANIVKTTIAKFFKNFYYAKDGKEGLDLFIEHKNDIDIIITDISMPNMDGITMSEKIKDIKSNVEIIILTAHNENQYLYRAIKFKAADFIIKPFDLQVLFESIKKVSKPILLQQKLEANIDLYNKEKTDKEKLLILGQLVSGMFHEINTPLTFIKGSIELIEYYTESVDEKTRKNINTCLEKMNDGTTRIQNMVSSIKELYDVTKDEKKDVNIYESVLTSLKMLSHQLKYNTNVFLNGKDYFDEIEDEVKTFIINAQPNRLKQVWLTVIENAMDELVKIEDFKDRKLYIDFFENDNKLTVKFKDNAGGIKDEIIENIFSAFKNSKDSSGVGIGLKIAKTIIDEHDNITIDAYNEDNGAVFEFNITK